MEKSIIINSIIIILEAVSMLVSYYSIKKIKNDRENCSSYNGNSYSPEKFIFIERCLFYINFILIIVFSIQNILVALKIV